jgi:hypothetical protein
MHPIKCAKTQQKLNSLQRLTAIYSSTASKADVATRGGKKSSYIRLNFLNVPRRDEYESHQYNYTKIVN